MIRSESDDVYLLYSIMGFFFKKKTTSPPQKRRRRKKHLCRSDPLGDDDDLNKVLFEHNQCLL